MTNIIVLIVNSLSCLCTFVHAYKHVFRHCSFAYQSGFKFMSSVDLVGHGIALHYIPESRVKIQKKTVFCRFYRTVISPLFYNYWKRLFMQMDLYCFWCEFCYYSANSHLTVWDIHDIPVNCKWKMSPGSSFLSSLQISQCPGFPLWITNLLIRHGFSTFRFKVLSQTLELRLSYMLDATLDNSYPIRLMIMKAKRRIYRERFSKRN